MFTNYRNFSAIAVAFIATINSCAALAAGSTGVPMTINATVASSCSISTTAANFSSYDPSSGSGATAAGGVTLTCTKAAVPALWLNQNSGTLAGGTGGTDTFAYTVVQPQSNSAGATCPTYGSGTAFPTSTGSPFTLTAAPNAAARSYNLCFQAAPNQNSSAGSYTGTITVNVNF